GGHAPERGVGRRVGIGRAVVADHRVGVVRAYVLVTRVAGLYPAGDHLYDQQAVGDVPGVVRVAVRVRDLHARLIPVLHRAHPAGAFGIRLVALLDRVRPPGPGARGHVQRHRPVGPRPDAQQRIPDLRQRRRGRRGRPAGG